MDNNVEPSIKRIAVLPWPAIPNCYLVVSGKLRKRERVGDKWYAGHTEITNKWGDDQAKSEPCISFTYAEDGVAAEWDGAHGPIQLWFRCESGFKNENGFDEGDAHWLWPFAYGSGHWSQMAVDEHDLPRRFNQGDYEYIFNVLRSFVRNRLKRDDAA